MPEKYTLQLRGNSEFDIVPPGPLVNLKNFKISDFDFLKKQLEFSYDVINGNQISCMFESEIIGKQLWKYIIESTLGNDVGEEYKVFKKLQVGLFQKIAIVISYINRNMDFECSIPWELVSFNRGSADQFLYEIDKVDLLRKYAGEKEIQNTLSDDELFKAPCKILLYVDGPEDEDEKKETGADCGEIIQYTKLKDALVQIANNINPTKQDNPYKNNHEHNFLQLKFIQKDFTKFLDTINEWKPTIVHIITHGRFFNGKAEVLISNSGLSFEWKNIDEISHRFINCSWHVPIFILEICEVGRSSLPLKLSAQDAKIIVANMFKINQELSQNFYCDFYSSLFEQKKTLINAFHEVRRNIFKLTYDKKLSYYGLPVLYYNLDVEKEISFETVLKENLPPEKTGGAAVTTDEELFFDKLNQTIKDLKQDSDQTSLAKLSIRRFIASININKNLKEKYSSRESLRTFFYNWLFGSCPLSFAAYDYLTNNWEELFNKLYEEIFENKDKIGMAKNVPSKQSATPTNQPDDSMGEKVNAPFNVYNIRAAAK